MDKFQILLRYQYSSPTKITAQILSKNNCRTIVTNYENLKSYTYRPSTILPLSISGRN